MPSMAERAWIVTGYDGSDNSRDGLALASLLATTLDCGVVAASILTFAPTEATWSEYGRVLRAEEQRLEAEAREALDAVERVETLSLPSPSPARELHDLAERREAALIVVGSTHRGPFGRVLPGTVADRLLSAAPCPVAVAPVGYRHAEQILDPILVAFDGSSEAKVALETAARLATTTGARLRLLAVADPHDARIVAPGVGGWAGLPITEQAMEAERARLTAAIDEALASLAGGPEASGEVVVDVDPRSAIVDATADVGMLVIGSRGYGPVSRVLLGGTASVLVRKAACPVVVTPRSLLAD